MTSGDTTRNQQSGVQPQRVKCQIDGENRKDNVHQPQPQMLCE